MVFESSANSKTIFLQDFLQKKFPRTRFHFFKFYDSKSAKTITSSKLAGVILELKTFSTDSLRAFDRFNRDFQNISQILILSPQVFQVLNQKKKEKIQSSMIAISETTSLDYLIQLPRLIEETGRKRLLRAQNERLQRLLQDRGISQGFGPNPYTEVIRDGKTISQLLQNEPRSMRSVSCGLKIKLRNWKTISKKFSDIAQNEVLEMISRMINQSVRNSDRVLRSGIDEFTIFLSHADASHLTRCKDRLEQRLVDLRIESNLREISLPFQISMVNHIQ